jgi:hypothetical protein
MCRHLLTLFLYDMYDCSCPRSLRFPAEEILHASFFAKPPTLINVTVDLPDSVVEDYVFVTSACNGSHYLLAFIHLGFDMTSDDIEMESVSWGLMEALMWDGPEKEEELSIHHALALDLDGVAFGATTYVPSLDGDMDIPHFPALSQAMLGEDGPRTSGE